MNRQRYRLRAPSTGREVILEGEPGRSYVDRETGEPLEAVGKLLPLPPQPAANAAKATVQSRAVADRAARMGRTGTSGAEPSCGGRRSGTR